MRSRDDAMEAGSADPANVIDALRAELMAVEPSPAFAAGVRQRIDARRAPRLVVQFSAAASLVIAAAWGVFGSAGSHEVVPATSAGPVVKDVSPPVAAPGAVLVPDEAARRRGPKVVAAPRGTAPALPTVVAESRFEVLVPADQAIAVQRLLQWHAAGRQLRLAHDGHARNWLTGALMPHRPVEIPLVTIEPLPGAEPGVGGKLK